MHFLIKEMATFVDGNIHIIPKTTENYISFTKCFEKKDLVSDGGCDASLNYENLKMRFIDSYRFLPSSLEKLASYLPFEKFQITKKEWTHLNKHELELLMKKGVYPYDYMTDSSKLYVLRSNTIYQLFAK